MKNRVGIVGLGSMGLNHARAIERSLLHEVIATFDPSPDGPSINGAKAIDRLEFFADFKPDYIVVSSPTNTHSLVARTLLPLRIPLLIEKPLALNSDEARSIAELATVYKVKVFVGHIERFNPALRKMKELLGQGIVGDLLQVKTRRVSPFSPRIKDVGVALDLGSHDIDLVRWLTGSEYKSLNIEMWHSADRSNEDLIYASGRMADGVVIGHEINWITPFKSRSVEALGTNGLLVADALGMSLTFFQNGMHHIGWDEKQQLLGSTRGPSQSFELDLLEPLIAEHLAMGIELSGGNGSDLASVTDGTEVLRVLEQFGKAKE